MKKIILITSLALGMDCMFAAETPAPALTPAQQAIALQTQGEQVYKNTQGKGYVAWRVEHDAEVFALAFQDVAATAALNPRMTSIIVRNYAARVEATKNPLPPLPGVAPVDQLAATYARATWIARFATAEQLATEPVTAGNCYSFAQAAKRLHRPDIKETAYKSRLGKASLSNDWKKWFSGYVATLPVNQAIAVIQRESRAVTALQKTEARDAWLEELMTMLSVSERVK